MNSRRRIARSPWPTWLIKPTQWRRPSTKRSLQLAGAMAVIMLAVEALFLSGDTQPFMVRSTASTDCAGGIHHHQQFLRVNNESSVISELPINSSLGTEPQVSTDHDESERESTAGFNTTGTGEEVNNSTDIIRNSSTDGARRGSSRTTDAHFGTSINNANSTNTSTAIGNSAGADTRASNTISRTRRSSNTTTSTNSNSTHTNSTKSSGTIGTGANTTAAPSITAVPSTSASQLTRSSSKCSPQTIDPQTIKSSDNKEFYVMMHSVSSRYPPPVFQGDATSLCDIGGSTRSWDYCLPISGSKDASFCHAKDQFNLLRPHTPPSLCFNSMLHLLLVEVYEEMKRLELHPALLYGTLLGAVRDGMTIPFTEDADIGFNTHGQHMRMNALKTRLAAKGFHMFHQTVWRVCIAPTHPLASNLYNPDMELLRGAWDAPYVDLYEMKLQNETTYRVDEAKPDPMIPRERIEPFSQVTLHGMKYDTVADPEFLLKREYGAGYMTPKSRKQRAPRTRKPNLSTKSVAPEHKNGTSPSQFHIDR